MAVHIEWNDMVPQMIASFGTQVEKSIPSCTTSHPSSHRPHTILSYPPPPLPRWRTCPSCSSC
jgi:hypothetical protein